MPEPSVTILNVNDHEASRYIVTRVLKTAGFQVIEAANGMEALYHALSLPDLIVLDVQLPDVSGFEVCRRLKADPVTRSIAILHLSASFIGSQDTALGLEGGADGYLTQPVEPPVLVAHIKALLRMRRAEEAAREKAIHWQTTFDALSDCVFLLDCDRRVMQCNHAMAELLGQSVDAIQGHLLADIAPVALDAAIPSVNAGRAYATDEVQVERRWFRVTTDPIPSGDGGLGGSVHAMIDITKRKQAEEENIRLLRQTQEASLRERAFMRDILNSVTEGKLCLCENGSDLPALLLDAEESILLTRGTLSALRSGVRAALNRQGFSEERIADLTTAVSEAGMNAVVHAGGGTGRIFTDRDRVQVWIEDHGGGIAVDRLPRATLQRGYTTAGTLGHGFKIMLQTADRVWLLTGPTGTTVVLEQEREAPSVLMQ